MKKVCAALIKPENKWPQGSQRDKKGKPNLSFFFENLLLILLEKYYYFFTFIGLLQHSKSISSQPQTVSTDTTTPQRSQEYFVPFLTAVLATGFFVAGFLVAIYVLLTFLCEADHII